MAAPFRSKTEGFNNSATTFTFDKPAGVVEGDFLWAQFALDIQAPTGVALTGGADWTLFGSPSCTGDGGSIWFYYKIAGASEPATYQFTYTGAATRCAYACAAYSDVDSANPIAASLITNPNLGTPPSSPVSMTAYAITSTANDQTILFGGFVDWSSNTACSFTAPTELGGFTERAKQTPASFVNCVLYDGVNATAGSTSEITAIGTLAGASGNYIVALVALKDNAGPPVIDVEPNSRAANVGGGAEFYCHANSNGGTGGAYQWATNDGGGWTNVGTNSPTYLRSPVDPADDGLQIRCTYGDSVGSDVSATATLTVLTSWPSAYTLGELAFSEFVPEGGGMSLVSASSSQLVNQTSVASILQTHLMQASISQSGQTCSVAGVAQTHLIGSLDSSQSSAASTGSVSQLTTTFVTGSNSSVTNVCSTAGVQATHLIDSSASIEAVACSQAAVQHTHAVVATNSIQVQQASTADIQQTRYVSVAGSQQGVSDSGAFISQTHNIAFVDSSLQQQISSGSIQHTHAVSCSNSQTVEQTSQAQVAQTQHVVVSTSQQASVASPGSVSQSSVTYVAGSSSSVGTQTSDASIVQTHNVGSVASQIGLAASVASVAQAHLVAAVDSSIACTVSTSDVSQTHLVGSTDSQTNLTCAQSSIQQVRLINPSSSNQLNVDSTGFVAQTHLVSATGSQTQEASTSADIKQTHLVGLLNSSSSIACSTGGVSQDNVTYIATSNSVCLEQASAAQVDQTHLISVAMVQQPTSTGDASIQQRHDVGAVNSTQAVSSTQASVRSTHLIVCAPVAVDEVALSSHIVQTHLVSAAGSIQADVATQGSIQADTSNSYVIVEPLTSLIEASTATVRQVHMIGCSDSKQTTLLSSAALWGSRGGAGAVVYEDRYLRKLPDLVSVRALSIEGSADWAVALVVHNVRGDSSEASFEQIAGIVSVDKARVKALNDELLLFL